MDAFEERASEEKVLKLARAKEPALYAQMRVNIISFRCKTLSMRFSLVGSRLPCMPANSVQQLTNLRQFVRRCSATPIDEVDPRSVRPCIQPEESLIVDPSDAAKLRLDAFLAAKLPHISRARLQTSIKEGLVEVNGRPQSKASHTVRPGDVIQWAVPPPPPLEALPEALPLNIVFEDDHLIVVDKSADMVMHPSPGHPCGTLVNALLHHSGLPGVRLHLDGPTQTEGVGLTAGIVDQLVDSKNERFVGEDVDDELSLLDESRVVCAVIPDAEVGSEKNGAIGSNNRMIVRPGIVHRLDKGTTGLVVVAKTDSALASLCEQFKDRSVERTYWSLTVRVPSASSGRIAANVGRDFRDRKKMAAFAYGSTRGRTAASNYRVLEVLSGGRSALVEWKLETGRTHQIRVHAKHIGHPLFGDETYGGGGGSAVGAVGGQKTAALAVVRTAIAALGRPALHAKTLGFVHPESGEYLRFDSDLPNDFVQALELLRSVS